MPGARIPSSKVFIRTEKSRRYAHRQARLCLFILGIMLCASGLLPRLSPAGVFGTWAPKDNRVQVQLFPCRDEVCGKIVRLQENGPTPVCHRLDRENPDPDKRTRRVLGLQIVSGFRQACPHLPINQETRWVGGFIYNPATGDTLGDSIFSYQMELVTADTLTISLQDCLMSCARNRTWQRVHTPELSPACPDH